MKLEDYSKYYIQGSDHYLVPKDIFVELFNEMINWKQENEELKSQLKGTTHCYDEAEHRQLKEQLSSITLQLEKLKENIRATNKGLQKVRLKRKKWKRRYELAKQYISILEQDTAELKKQLEATKEVAEENMKKWVIMKNQQQEFIKYLEDEIFKNTPTARWKHYDEDGCCDYTIETCNCVRIQPVNETLKEILQKYLEIIGDDK